MPVVAAPAPAPAVVAAAAREAFDGQRWTTSEGMMSSGSIHMQPPPLPPPALPALVPQVRPDDGRNGGGSGRSGAVCSRVAVTDGHPNSRYASRSLQARFALVVSSMSHLPFFLVALAALLPWSTDGPLTTLAAAGGGEVNSDGRRIRISCESSP